MTPPSTLLHPYMAPCFFSLLKIHTSPSPLLESAASFKSPRTHLFNPSAVLLQPRPSFTNSMLLAFNLSSSIFKNHGPTKIKSPSSFPSSSRNPPPCHRQPAPSHHLPLHQQPCPLPLSRAAPPQQHTSMASLAASLVLRTLTLTSGAAPCPKPAPCRGQPLSSPVASLIHESILCSALSHASLNPRPAPPHADQISPRLPATLTPRPRPTLSSLSRHHDRSQADPPALARLCPISPVPSASHQRAAELPPHVCTTPCFTIDTRVLLLPSRQIRASSPMDLLLRTHGLVPPTICAVPAQAVRAALVSFFTRGCDR